MKTRKTNTTNRPPKYTTLLAALAAMTLTGAGVAEARTDLAESGASPVTTVSREDFNQAGVGNIGELLSRTPGVVTDTYANGRYNTNPGNNINLRGLGNSQTGNGYVIDGVPYNTGNVYNPTGGFVPVDLERVEVLRGPQGTLFGRNTNGGVINTVTRGDNTNGTGYTVGDRYNLGTGYRTNDSFTNNLNFDPKGLGTDRFNTDLTAGLRYDTGDSLTPSVNTDPVTLNPDYTGTGYRYDWTPQETLQDTVVNTDTVTNTTTDTPVTGTDTLADNTPAKAPCPETGGAVNNQTTQTPDNAVYGGGGGSYNNYQGGYGGPCPRGEIDWSRVRIRIAEDARIGASNTAQSLIHQSQPRPFFDFTYHNTATDELANRAAIGYQLSQGLSLSSAYNPNISGCIVGDPRIPNGGLPPAHGPVVENDDTPKTYYRVDGGMGFGASPISDDDTTDNEDVSTDDTSATTTATAEPEETPIPDYKPVVKPIDVNELSDRQLEIEIEYGPSITAGYLREAGSLRKDSERYRNWAKERREQAARARADAENARERAEKAKKDGKNESQEFWERQAEAYDSHAEILEENARILDRSAQNNDAAAETYEQDAAQTATNTGQAAGELANRHGQRAAQAAREQAAREAEAARVEAERQKALNDLIRRSQQNTQSNTGNGNNNTAGHPSGRNSGPDMREPQIGREPRNETLRKLLD